MQVSGERDTSIYDEPRPMAGRTPEEDGSLFHFHYLNWLYLGLIQRMGLIFYLMEVNIQKIDASDIAVPCRPVVELHGLEV